MIIHIYPRISFGFGFDLYFTGENMFDEGDVCLDIYVAFLTIEVSSASHFARCSENPFAVQDIIANDEASSFSHISESGK